MTEDKVKLEPYQEYHSPDNATREHVPDLEQFAYNQMPKAGWSEPRLFRYAGTDLYQWYAKKGNYSPFEDAFGEPFVIARRSPLPAATETSDFNDWYAHNQPLPAAAGTQTAGVRVKGLEWGPSGADTGLCALYYVRQHDDGKWGWHLTMGPEETDRFASANEAKAAAQADYESRILSALAVPTTAGEGWQLVPKEPTPEMLQAAMPFVGEVATIPSLGQAKGVNPELYRAMLAAAPHSPSEH